MRIDSLASGETISFDSRSLYIILNGKLVGKDSTISDLKCIDGVAAEFTALSQSYVASIPIAKLEHCLGGPIARISIKNAAIAVFRRVSLLRALPARTLDTLAAVL